MYIKIGEMLRNEGAMAALGDMGVVCSQGIFDIINTIIINGCGLGPLIDALCGK